jgi:restriction system protein
MTWEEFQAAFQETWLNHYFSPEIAKRLDPLISYVEPLLPRWIDNLSEADQEEYFALRKRYEMFGMGMMVFFPYLRMLRHTGWPSLPIAPRTPPEFRENIPEDVLNVRAYRELLAAATRHAEEAIALFRAVRDRANLLENPKFT